MSAVLRYPCRFDPRDRRNRRYVSICGDNAHADISTRDDIASLLWCDTWMRGRRRKQIGLGIHGEAGIRQTDLQSADDLADTIISAVVGSKSEGTQLHSLHAAAATFHVFFVTKRWTDTEWRT